MQWVLLFAPLVLQLVLLYFLSAALNRIAYARLGKWIYLLIMWPGVAIHELSHTVGCLLTGTRIYEVKLFSPREESPGNMVLGFVMHAPPRDPLATFVVSAAPFFGGAAALWALLHFGAPHALDAVRGTFDLSSAGAAARSALDLGRSYLSFATSLAASLDWRSWRTYAFLFLLFVVAAHVAPSSHDMKYAVGGAAGLAVLLTILVWLGGRFAPALTARAAGWTAEAVAAVSVLLGYGLAFVAIAAIIALVADAALGAL